MNVYIICDVEGVAGVVFYEHFSKDMSPLAYEVLRRNRVLLTQELNAAARGAFAAGATTVVAHDHHGAGYTIRPEEMDKRVELIHGRPEQNITIGTQHPDLDSSFDAVVLIGMHAKAGTLNGCTPHSLICVTDGDGRTHELGEGTYPIYYAGDHDVPCVFISGDKATVEDALSVNPVMEGVVTKKHYASQLARTLSPELSRERIEDGARRALGRLDQIKPRVIPGPCSVQVADRNPAARWPKTPNTLPTFVEAMNDTLMNVPWYKPVEKIDDGWRFPDRKAPTETPNDQWNTP